MFYSNEKLEDYIIADSCLSVDDMVDLDVLMTIQIPSQNIIEKISEWSRDTDIKFAIRCTHNLKGDISPLVYPAWLASYWLEVSAFWILKRKWSAAELFLIKYRSGNLGGFICGGTMETLVTYPSQDWFSSIHISQNSELIQLDLIHAQLKASHEVVEDHFFTLLQRFHREQSSGDYGSEGTSSYHWRLGEEFAHGSCKWVWGVANINGNHWVAVGMSQAQKFIHYGDSMGNIDTDLYDAPHWWTENHTKAIFSSFNLPITQQVNDKVSCGVFGLNAICTSVFHGSVEVVRESDTTVEQIHMFTCVAQQEIDTQSYYSNEYECTTLPIAHGSSVTIQPHTPLAIILSMSQFCPSSGSPLSHSESLPAFLEMSPSSASLPPSISLLGKHKWEVKSTVYRPSNDIRAYFIQNPGEEHIKEDRK
ncbi:hypothetical protein BDQ17DRAFT_1335937 [Cyathus striatus]|nr:hypothetical protein BDQ17DRAFT_1335937 [Cyathus striatus]